MRYHAAGVNYGNGRCLFLSDGQRAAFVASCHIGMRFLARNEVVTLWMDGRQTWTFKQPRKK